jgi:hypothetical protein
MKRGETTRLILAAVGIVLTLMCIAVQMAAIVPKVG